MAKRGKLHGPKRYVVGKEEDFVYLRDRATGKTVAVGKTNDRQSRNRVYTLMYKKNREVS